MQSFSLQSDLMKRDEGGGGNVSERGGE